MVWASPDAVPLSDGAGSIEFNGTVYTEDEPNGFPIEPDTYLIVGKMSPSGVPAVGAFFVGPAEVTFVEDP